MMKVKASILLEFVISILDESYCDSEWTELSKDRRDSIAKIWVKDFLKHGDPNVLGWVDLENTNIRDNRSIEEKYLIALRSIRELTENDMAYDDVDGLEIDIDSEIKNMISVLSK